MGALVTLQNVGKVYTQAEVKTSGIVDVFLEVEPGAFIAITGRSGCGKSTLLNILGMMDSLTVGRYLFCGQDVTQLKGRRVQTFGTRRLVSFSSPSIW